MKLARIELWNGDICDLEVDAIVNPANLSLWMATGVGGAIKRAGGDAIEFAAVRQAPVPLGGAIVTTAGNLAARRRSSTPCRSIATDGRAARSSRPPPAARWPGPARSAPPASPSRPSGRVSVGSRSRRRHGSRSAAVRDELDSLTRHRGRDLRPARRGCLRGVQCALAISVGGQRRRSPRTGRPPRAPDELPVEPTEDQRDELVEQVAREIQLRGLTVTGRPSSSRPAARTARWGRTRCCSSIRCSAVSSVATWPRPARSWPTRRASSC